MRQTLGGTYSAGAWVDLERDPVWQTTLVLSFGCAPDRVDELTKVAEAEVEKLRQGQFLASDLQKVRETRSRSIEPSLQKNSFWMSMLTTYLFWGAGADQLLKWQERIDRITPPVLLPLAQTYLDPAHRAEFIMVPEATAPH